MDLSTGPFDATERFFELLLGTSATATMYSHCEIWKGRQWHTSTVTGRHPTYAANWVHKQQNGHAAYVTAGSAWEQIAAAVKLSGETAALDLAFFPVPPTFAVITTEEDPLYAVWSFNEAVRWYPGANLSHALARRLGGSATNRIPVPGTRAWPLSPFMLTEVKSEFYDPEELRARLKSIRGKHPARRA